MISGTRLRWALQNMRRGHGHDSAYATLSQMLRTPHYDHQVIVPITRCSARDGIVLPPADAAQWLFDERDKGTIGPWDVSVGNDARYGGRMTISFDPNLKELEPIIFRDEFYLTVSFLMEEDAILYKMKW